MLAKEWIWLTSSASISTASASVYSTLMTVSLALVSGSLGSSSTGSSRLLIVAAGDDYVSGRISDFAQRGKE
jgi:hypothetical protein